MLFEPTVSVALSNPCVEMLFVKAIRKLIRRDPCQLVVAMMRRDKVGLHCGRDVAPHVGEGQQSDAQVSGYLTENFHGAKMQGK